MSAKNGVPQTNLCFIQIQKSVSKQQPQGGFMVNSISQTQQKYPSCTKVFPGTMAASQNVPILSQQFLLKQICPPKQINRSTTYRIPFTPEEDEKLKSLTSKYGTRSWSLIASFMAGRTPKQCRDRYSNYLVPGYFKGQWSNEEDQLLLKLYQQHGPKWSIIQRSFYG